MSYKLYIMGKIWIAFFYLLFSIKADCQKQVQKFSIVGKISGKDTGNIVLMYFDSNNKHKVDTILLNKGTFKVNGTVNRLCESIIWTNLTTNNFDAPTNLRFLLEPKKIHIYFNPNNKKETWILGSKTQYEKFAFDKEKWSLLETERICNESLKKLNKNASNLKNQKDSIYELIGTAKQQRLRMDLNYIAQKPNSNLSGFLLTARKQKIPIDTLEYYYIKCNSYFLKSSLAKELLEYIHSESKNDSFKKKYPLYDVEFLKKLEKITSIYDIVAFDTLGITFNFNEYKGKYILLDLWASWCKPCIDNIPYLTMIEERYKNVKVISFSVDTKMKTWKNSINYFNFKSTHISDLKGFSGLLPSKYNVLYVPHYILFDKSGKLFLNNCPQPSSKEILELLDTLN